MRTRTYNTSTSLAPIPHWWTYSLSWSTETQKQLRASGLIWTKSQVKWLNFPNSFTNSTHVCHVCMCLLLGKSRCWAEWGSGGWGGNLSFWDLDISPATIRLVSSKILTSFKSGFYYSKLMHSSYNVKLRTLSSHVRVFMVCWCWSLWL